VDRWRLPHLQQPLRAGGNAAFARADEAADAAHQARPDSIFDYKYDDFELVGYESHPRSRRRWPYDAADTDRRARAQRRDRPRQHLAVAPAGRLQHFKRTTMGAPIIMGRKTWDSIGRPLPGAATSW
jgi:hypothetical protein